MSRQSRGVGSCLLWPFAALFRLGSADLGAIGFQIANSCRGAHVLDGKRFIVARRNEPRGRDLLAITDIEGQVLEFASFGHANKLIAYELGLAPSTISVHLRRGLRKLGPAHPSELVALRGRGGGAGDA